MKRDPLVYDRTLISLPQAQDFVIRLPVDDPRRGSLSQLFMDQLLLSYEAQQLEAGCIGKPGFATFECCKPHQTLSTRGDNISERRESLSPPDLNRKEFPPGSQVWWDELGFDMPIMSRVVSTPVAPTHYTMTYISVMRVEAFYAHLAELPHAKTDRRIPLVPHYLAFLRFMRLVQHRYVWCAHLPEVETWECCDQHRLLSEQRKMLIEDLPNGLPVENVFTREWWQKLGFTWREPCTVLE